MGTTTEQIQEVRHTPTPWKADGLTVEAVSGGNIGLMNLASARAVSEANAAFIVAAVNNYAKYRLALARIRNIAADESRNATDACNDICDIATEALESK